jgi:hypothetical protein
MTKDRHVSGAFWLTVALAGENRAEGEAIHFPLNQRAAQAALL